MTLAPPIVFAGALTLILSSCAALFGSRTKQTLPGFFYANHRLNLGFVLNLLLSTPFSVNGILYQAFLGYAVGWAGVLTQVAWCASYFWLYRYQTKVAEEARYQTLHGAIGARFGNGAERAAAFATAIGFTLQIGWEVIVGASVLSAGFSPTRTFFWLAGLGLALAASAYTMLGGLRGNARANTFQNLVAAFALMALTWFMITWNGAHVGTSGPWDAGSPMRLFTAIGFWGAITNIVFSLLWQFVDMSTWQTMAAADKDSKGNRWALFASGIIVFIFPGVVGTAIGMYARGIDGLTPDNILPRLIELLASNPLFVVLVVAGLVCAMLSTLDGLMLSISQAWTFDLRARDEIRSIMAWYKNAAAEQTGSEGQGGPREREQDLPSDLVRAEQQVFSMTRFAILSAALLGSTATIVLTQYLHVNIFDLVYIVVLAQLLLFPLVISCLRNAGGTAAGGAEAIWIALSVGVVLVVIGVWSKETTWLQLVPLVSLGTSWLVLKVAAR